MQNYKYCFMNELLILSPFQFSINLFNSSHFFLQIYMFTILSSKDLHQCYSGDPHPRYHSLIQKFQSCYQSPPDFISRAPGRVNLIGQHIDYEGYGVLPAAIQKDCLIAVKRVQTQFIEVRHVLEDQFPTCKLSKYPSKISESIPSTYAKYFAAGYRAGLLDLIQEQKVTGLQILIEGNIPWASGVSSSSAFCVCSAITSNHANKVQNIKKQEFVERCIRFQRQVGTASGGMDQSISILGKMGSCLFIEFNPIRGTKINMPSQEYKFIIMNSLVESAKLNTAVYRYNKRVCQCRISVHLLAKNLKIDKDIYKKWTILKEIQEWVQLPINQMPLLVKQFIPKKKYTQEQLQNILACPLLDCIGDIPLAKEVLAANQYFQIHQAAYHVFTEAYRVLNFIEICKSPIQNVAKGILLGQLMNQSQDSCRDVYKCSCQQLDELTKLARQNGAVGSRLTGAGWGGCSVSMVPSDKSQQFMKQMQESYFGRQQIKVRVEKAGGISNCLFGTQPSEGACVISIQ